MTRLAENIFRVSTLRWALYNFADTLQTPCSFDDIGVENVFFQLNVDRHLVMRPRCYLPFLLLLLI